MTYRIQSLLLIKTDEHNMNFKHSTNKDCQNRHVGNIFKTYPRCATDLTGDFLFAEVFKKNE